MKKFKIILQVFILLFSVTTLITSCTDENNPSQDLDSSDNELTQEFKSIGNSLSLPSYGFQVSNENTFLTKGIEKYLNKSSYNQVESFEVDTKTEKGILKINTLLLNDDVSSKNSANEFTSVVDVEDDLGNNVMLIFRFEKLTEEDGLKILEIQRINDEPSNLKMSNKNNCYGSYSAACIDSNGDGEVSYGECFGACIGYALDTDELSGQIITGLGIAGGAGCGPCGITAAAISTFVLIGCAGGCA